MSGEIIPNDNDSNDKLLAGISYLGAMILWIPTIIILVLKKDSAYVKFHCFQALSFILVTVACWIISFVLTVIGAVPVLGWIAAMAGGLVMLVLSLGIFIYWLILTIKAFTGDTMEIPFVGEYIRNNLMDKTI